MKNDFQGETIAVMRKLTVSILQGIMRGVLDTRGRILKNGVLLLAIFLTCLISPNAIASEMHKSHEHGEANLTLVFERGALEMQLETPAMSLLGFEHKPKTKKQFEAIKKTKEILSSSAKVVSIAGAYCTTNKVEVEFHGPVGRALRNSDESHINHSYDEEHDDHGANHSEVLATYRFDCVEEKKIRSISIALFETFPRLETIKANWVTETQQGQSTLRPISPTIEFK